MPRLIRAVALARVVDELSAEVLRHLQEAVSIYCIRVVM
jgi:hypothetical protein